MTHDTWARDTAAAMYTSSLAELDDLLGMVAERDPEQVPPADVLAAPRGRTSRLKRVALPEGWLDSRSTGNEELEVVAGAELSVSGG